MNVETNTRMLPLKILYFFFFAGQGIFFTFVNVYYNSIGLSGTQIGIINTIMPLVGMVSSPIWGLISDRTGKTKQVLVISVSGVIIAALALSFTRSFFILLPLTATFALFSTTIMPLVDSTTLRLLGDQRERYGAQRVWGTIGFMISSSIAGIVFASIGLQWLFVAYAITMCGFLVSIAWLPNYSILQGSSLMHGIRVMVRQPAWLLFMGSLSVLGLAMAGMSNFLGLMVKEMGGTASLIGLMWTFAAIAELPVMLFSATLLRRFGAKNLMAVALGMYGARMLLYGFMEAPEWAAAINLLGGVSFGLYWISAVNYANELAPANLKATSQGLLVAVTSLSMMVGAIFTGWLYDSIGPWLMFRILAGCCLLAVILFGAGRVFIKRQEVCT